MKHDQNEMITFLLENVNNLDINAVNDVSVCCCCSNLLNLLIPQPLSNLKHGKNVVVVVVVL